MSRFRIFGRQILRYYEDYPTVMNSIAGSFVYLGGEAIVQYSETRTFDKTRLLQIGLLGCVENGSAVTTPIVLTKCALDQIFFATQQDMIFLGVCAIHDNNKLDIAAKEVQANFLTTWMNDCSVWPIVNFVGFAWIPTKLLPTYMSSIQLFWQIYLSSKAKSAAKVANGRGDTAAATTYVGATSGTGEESEEDKIIEEMFHKIDLDNSGTIDKSELKRAFESYARMKISDAELNEMLREADIAEIEIRSRRAEQNLPNPNEDSGSNSKRGEEISLAEFKLLHKKQDALRTRGLWEAMDRQLMPSLKKGAILNSLDRVKKLNRAETVTQQPQFSVTAAAINATGGRNGVSEGMSTSSSARSHSIADSMNGNTDDIDTRNSFDQEGGAQWMKERKAAIGNAFAGGTALIIAAVVRKVILKI